MSDRRIFLKTGFLGSLSVFLGLTSECKTDVSKKTGSVSQAPLIISTWEPNHVANEVAFKVLESGGSVLDAIEAGIRIPEADPKDVSVGYGGYPDSDGKVVLDACIMNDKGDFGAVIGLEGIMHAISVARKVLEQSSHVYLAGDGALTFALEQGFVIQDLLTEHAKTEWLKWKEKGSYDPMITPRSILERIESNHDTIGMLGMDANGNLSGGCSTSGLAFKARGRVGDSPIIGSGLYVDNEVGAATATGVGEEVAKVCGAHTIVEQMRAGATPEEACMEAIRRIVKKDESLAREIQVGFIAVNKQGEYGGFSINENFSYAVRTAQSGSNIIKSPHWF